MDPLKFVCIPKTAANLRLENYARYWGLAINRGASQRGGIGGFHCNIVYSVQRRMWCKVGAISTNTTIHYIFTEIVIVHE